MAKLTLHPRWLENLDSAEFRASISEMLDRGLSAPLFAPFAHDKVEFCKQLVAHNMSRLVPSGILSLKGGKKSKEEADAKIALSQLASGEKMDKDMAMSVAAAHAYACGIDAIIYSYMGGWDEIDPDSYIQFECCSTNLSEYASDVWTAICDIAGITEDDMFWSLCHDSGAGDGTSYTNTIRVETLTMLSQEGEPEYEEEDEEEDDDDLDDGRYSDESEEEKEDFDNEP